MQNGAEFPEELSLSLKKAQVLRYGENPHQKAALYLFEDGRPSVVASKQVQGKELSYNNLLDADAAFACVAEFEEPAAVIVKHTNPCGVAVAENVAEAYLRALACDELSAFGGIVALNSSITEALALELVKIFLEVIVAPDAEDAALAILSTKPNVRVLLTGSGPASPDEQASRGGPDTTEERTTVRSVSGGLLVQTSDSSVFIGELRTVTKRTPSPTELADMSFAFTIAKHVKSNAIVFAKHGATVGIGAGQMSRIYSVKTAAMKAADAGLSLEGSVLASDAFFPFPDVVEEAQKLGVTAIIQPGGSKKDQDSIDAADAAGMAMVFTGVRHFRH